MARLSFTARALRDLDRLSDFLLENDPAAAMQTGKLLIDGLRILIHHPLVGRSIPSGLRELVISRGRTGYIALYRFDDAHDVVHILAIRHQRELGSP